MEVKWKITYHFRKLQRCRSWEDWSDSEGRFLREVHDVIMSQEASDVPATTIKAATEQSGANAAQGKVMHQTQSAHERGRRGTTLARGRGGRRQASKAKGQKTPSQIGTDQLVAQWEYLRDYFKVNWFTEEWIREF